MPAAQTAARTACRWVAVRSSDWKPGGVIGVVLAHQGGWDEILFVAVPVGLFAILLFVANRRAQAQLDSTAAQGSAPASGPDEPERPESGSLDGRPD